MFEQAHQVTREEVRACVSDLHLLAEPLQFSPHLCRAIDEIAAEADKPEPDWQLLAALTGVKSFISTGVDWISGTHHFTETLPSPDYDGDSAYRLLDSLHHAICLRTAQIPRGMIVFARAEGGVTLGTYQTTEAGGSPTLRLIAEEEAACEERSRQWLANYRKEVGSDA